MSKHIINYINLRNSFNPKVVRLNVNVLEDLWADLLFSIFQFIIMSVINKLSITTHIYLYIFMIL